MLQKMSRVHKSSQAMKPTAAKRRMVRDAGSKVKDPALPVLGSIMLQSFLSHLE